MYSMAMNVIKLTERKSHEFQVGYHAEPSMQQLHLHVISTDFNSPTLKTKRHWNSFHTKLFIPHHGKSIFIVKNTLKKTKNGKNFILELVKRISGGEKIKKLDSKKVDELRRTPLLCHRCTTKASTIQSLKAHLVVHVKQKITE